MATELTSANVQVYSTCPASNEVEQQVYLRKVVDAAQWSERAGCAGMLVYSDNSLVDPWLVAQIILQNTTRLRPLVAVQPIYMHPYSAAKMIASLAHLHGRAVDLNMVAGGFRNDLSSLNDPTAHDDRYARLVEYTTVVQRLIAEPTAITYEGRFYTVKNLKLAPPVPPELRPRILLSGSSSAGLDAARTLAATAIRYPRPAADEVACDSDSGVRVGIIAREDAEDAWAVAWQRFPASRRGQLAHQLAMKVSDSEWHRQLSDLAAAASEAHPYWLHPFENYQTFCPYLVGHHDRVAAEIRRYVSLGYSTFILDIPASQTDLDHIGIVFRRATENWA